VGEKKGITDKNSNIRTEEKKKTTWGRSGDTEGTATAGKTDIARGAHGGETRQCSTGG